MGHKMSPATRALSSAETAILVRMPGLPPLMKARVAGHPLAPFRGSTLFRRAESHGWLAVGHMTSPALRAFKRPSALASGRTVAGLGFAISPVGAAENPSQTAPALGAPALLR